MSNVTLVRGMAGTVGVVDGRECLITKSGQAGAVVFGPYEDREAGRYRVEFEVGRAPGEATPMGDPVVAVIDVLANRGHTLLNETYLLYSRLGGGFTKFTLEFDVQERRSIEYRVHATGKTGIVCSDRVSLERLGDSARIAKPLSAQQIVWRNEREFLDGYLRNVQGLIHVGANMGQERRYYWLLGLDVIWVEPIKEVYDILVDHVSRYPRQRAIQALLTARSGEEITFRIANNAGASSSILPFEDHSIMFPGVRYNEERTLMSTTLAEVVRNQGIPLDHYKALTLDVEGAEKMVLQGATEVLKEFKYVKCEVSDFPARTGTPNVGDLDALLSAAGFRELGRRAFSDGPNNQGTAWDIVWKRVDPGEQFQEPSCTLPLVFNPTEVEAVEKCE